MTDESMYCLLDDFGGLPTSRDTDLASRFVESLPIDGACVSVIADGGRQTVLSSTDLVAVQFDEAQWEVGQGPYWDALCNNQIVDAPLLTRSAAHDWPDLLGVIAELGLESVVSLPLHLGSAVIGVVTLYSTRQRALPQDGLETAAMLARAITFPAIRRAFTAAMDDGPAGIGLGGEARAVIESAIDTLAKELDVTKVEAFLHLQARGLAGNLDLESAARSVIAASARRSSVVEPR
jgi:hypothetical protein